VFFSGAPAASDSIEFYYYPELLLFYNVKLIEKYLAFELRKDAKIEKFDSKT
jgi:hypothetical protein